MVSPNTQLRQRADNDVNSRAKKILTAKSEAVEPELERIRESLIEHRDNRDTTNRPEVERQSSNKRVEAIRRRMKSKQPPKSRQSENATRQNKSISSDSGTPDSIAGSGGGDGDSGGGGGDGGGS